MSNVTDFPETLLGSFADRKLQFAVSNSTSDFIPLLIEAQEQERDRIARELHDSIGGNMVAATLLLNSIENKEPELEEAIRLITDCHQEVRSISHNLTSKKIDELLFPELIRHFLGRSVYSSGLATHIVIEPETHWEVVEKSTLIMIYRIIQELASNVIRHAKAKQLSVSLIRNERHIDLTISDDGVGFNYNPDSIGMGIRNVLMRVKTCHGTGQIQSQIGKGTKVEIKLPYQG